MVKCQLQFTNVHFACYYLYLPPLLPSCPTKHTIMEAEILLSLGIVEGELKQVNELLSIYEQNKPSDVDPLTQCEEKLTLLGGTMKALVLFFYSILI